MTALHEQPSMTTGQVIENLSIAAEHFLLALRLPPSMATPKPGQFVMLRDPEREEPLLPRPLSVYGFRRDGDQAILELLYRVAGRGTEHFSHLTPGAFLTVLGPLGRGFTLRQDVRQVILLAGGVGVAPLTYLLHEGCVRQDPSLKRKKITAYVGARKAELLTGLDRLQGFCDLMTATDDGSAGYHGLVTDLLGRDLGGYDATETMIYACGPTPMIRSIARMVGKTAIGCEVSLEERMACGIGACLGCAVAVKDGHGRIAYRRVCHDGPVFDIREIVLNPCLKEQDQDDGIG